MIGTHKQNNVFPRRLGIIDSSTSIKGLAASSEKLSSAFLILCRNPSVRRIKQYPFDLEVRTARSRPGTAWSGIILHEVCEKDRYIWCAIRRL